MIVPAAWYRGWRLPAWRFPAKSLRDLRREGSSLGSTAALLGGDVTADDVAEQFPFLALEPLHLQLADGREIGGAGVDLHARQQCVGHEVLQACRLLHHVGPGEV